MLRISVLSRAVISCGTRAGASTPYQVKRSYPLNPDSSSVGIDGISGARFALATASALSLPVLSKGSDPAMPVKLMSVWSVAFAVALAAPPLYGIWAMFTLTKEQKSAAARRRALPTLSDP